MIAIAPTPQRSQSPDKAISAFARVNGHNTLAGDSCDDPLEFADDQGPADPDVDDQESGPMPDFGDDEANEPLDGHSTEADMLAQINQAADRHTNTARLDRGEAQATDADPEEWLSSDAWRHYTRKGCRDERNRDFRPPSPPLWLCDFLGSREKADVLAAIIYWFGTSSTTNQPMARHRDRRGRRFLYKKQDEIANEAGISGSRRREKIGGYLKDFAELGLLEYKTNSRQTTIWLIPSGIQRAYDSVLHHQE